MKNNLSLKKNLLLFIVLHTSTLSAFSQWAIDTLSSGRSNFDAVIFENKVYFIGGEIDWYDSLLVSSEVAIYNCLTSGWELPNYITSPRSHSASVSGDSGIYVFGGRKFTIGHAWIREFAASNKIDIFKNGAWQVDSTVITGGVWGGHGLKVGSKIMFAGMVDSIEYLTSEFFASNQVYIYDELTGAWSIDTLSSPRTELAVATDGTIAMFAGGVNGLGHTSDVVDIYNSVTGVWSTANLSVPRCFLAGAYANGKFYFAGGELGGLVNYQSDVIDVYDGSAWTTTHLSSPRAGVEAAVVNDNIYFMGGGNYNLSFLPYPNTPNNYPTPPNIDSIVDVLITSTGSWIRADLNYRRLEFAQTTWGTKIFVGGGCYRTFVGSGINNKFDYVEIRDVATIGITDIADDISINVYPNPSNGPATILLPGNEVDISVTDILGHEILKTKTTERKLNLQLNNNGMYLIFVKSKIGSAIRKLLVNR